MNKISILAVIFFFVQTSSYAKDYILEFVEENYKESQSSFSYSPVIYHSIQVSSDSGPKLIVLKGDDYSYRKWLRQYIGQGKTFIAKVPDEQTDLFISSHVFDLDVKNIHPFNLNLYRQGEEKIKNNPGKFENWTTRSSSKKVNDSSQRLDKKKLSKESAEQLKRKKAEALKKESQKKDQLKKDEKKRLEKEQLLKAKAQKKSEEALKWKEELEKKRKENLEKLAAIEEQKAADQLKKQEELEKRWLELKKRLLEDDRIKALGLEERRQELERRWLELKAEF